MEFDNIISGRAQCHRSGPLRRDPMRSEEFKILRTIPAEGSRAHFKQEGGEPDALDRVVCFALVEVVERGHKRQEVRPISASDVGVEFCEYTSNFSGVTHEREEQ